MTQFKTASTTFIVKNYCTNISSKYKNYGETIENIIQIMSK